MQLCAEISLYPLQEQYVPEIKAFIDRLNEYADIKTQTSATSTIVVGEYAVLMQILTTEMQRTHEAVGQAIFVCKFLNADKANIQLA